MEMDCIRLASIRESVFLMDKMRTDEGRKTWKTLSKPY